MTEGPFVLALDAAGAACSVAAAAGDVLLAAARVETAHGQAERLMPLVDRTMRAAGLVAAALDLIAATVGPGSFTGIRVGLAAAQGIALATGKPLFGVTSFEAVAAGPALHAVARDCVLLIALESRREDLYVQLFDRRRRLFGEPIGEPVATMTADLACLVGGLVGEAPLLVAGDAAGRAAAALAHRPCVSQTENSAPDAQGVWRAALCRWRQGARAGGAQPLYLRPPSTSSPNRVAVPKRARS